MHRICFILSVVSLIICSCTNDASDSEVFSQPPYDKLTDSIRQQPTNADLYYRRAGLLYSNNQPNFAEADLRTAWKIDPKEDYALSLITLLKEKSPDSAIIFIQQAQSKLPGSIALKIGLARGYQQKNNLDKAMDICNSIISQFPNQIDAFVLKSDILKAQNKQKEALIALEKAHTLSPDDKELAYNLDYDFAEAKDPKAIAMADTLIRLDSTETSARAFYVKGIYYQAVHNDAEAIKNYDLAIERDFNFMDAYLDKGHLLYDQKNYQAALKDFQLALKISPTTAEFYYWLGKTQQALGNAADAKLNYQRAYGLDKTMKEAKEAADSIKS